MNLIASAVRRAIDVHSTQWIVLGKPLVYQSFCVTRPRFDRGLGRANIVQLGLTGELLMEEAAKAAKPRSRILLICAGVCAYFLLILSIQTFENITHYYFLTQDRYVLAFLILLLPLVGFIKPRFPVTMRPLKRSAVFGIATSLVFLLWLGTYAVMDNYALTRDEHMVLFDGYIFSKGRLSLPLPPQWSNFVSSLVPVFLLDTPRHAAVVSAYGPGNAAMRAAFAWLLDPALYNPLLAGLGLVALIDISKRVFPGQTNAWWVCGLGYVLSTQVLANAMTTYAMTSHLALNLAWLALFLRGRNWQIALTMIIGFWSIGLHQIIFHPLFAAPFIMTLLPQRKWRMFAAYAAVYSAGLLFWTAYPSLVIWAAGLHADSGTGTGVGGFFHERVMSLIARRNPDTLVFTFYNLARFICWNAIFLIPLVIFAWPAVREKNGIALPLAAGVALTLAAMVFLLPYQGHGYGYRYLHPVLGNLLLLAGYGYLAWSARDKAVADGSIAVMSLATVLLAVPFLLATTHSFVSPQATLDRLMARQKADFVIVDTEHPYSAIDQVRNLPDMSNRPLRFASDRLSQDQLRQLCDRGTINIIRRSDFHRTGFVRDLPTASPQFEKRTAWLANQPCVLATTP